jgi:hypothetical protein
MTSKAETVLLALAAKLMPLGGGFVRNSSIPVRVPPTGFIILRDGDPGEPETTMSPLMYHFEHTAEIEIYIQRGAGRDQAFDTLRTAIGAALVADRTLGGLCDWVEPQGPRAVELPTDDTVPIKAAVIPVVLTYSTSTPL